MNNNSQQIDRYLQNEMSAEEKSNFENQLSGDKELKEELIVQQQIMQAVNDAGIKIEFAKAIQKRIITKRLVQAGIIIAITAIISTLILFAIKNHHPYQGEENASINPPFSERFDINNNTDTIIETKDGVVFAIPAGAFNSNNKSIQLEIKTALTALDVIQNGLSTMSNDSLLQTAGMFSINGYDNGKLLSMSKNIEVSIPAKELDPAMQLFDGVADSSGIINWVNPKPIGKNLRNYDISQLDFYPPNYIPVLKSLGKDWANKKYTDSSVKIQVDIFKH